MIVKLCNIGCHIDKQFKLSNVGLIRLVGQSGAGKSTILRAIQYAFYGGKKSAPKTFGAKNCSVNLVYKIHGEKVKIFRQSNPQRLTVNDMEGEIAQSYLEKLLGMNADEFKAISYIEQKSQNSILFMGPADRLNYIEKIAFNEKSHPQQVKKIIKKLSKKRNMEMEASQQFYDMLLKEYKKLKEELNSKFDEIPECPVEDIDEWEHDIQDTIDMLKKFTREKTELESKIKNVEKIATLEQNYQKQKTKIDAQIQKMVSELENIGDAWIEQTEIDAKNSIQKYNAIIEYKTIENELIKYKKEHDELQKQEIEKYKKRIFDIENELQGFKNVDIQIVNVNREIERLNKRKVVSDNVRKIMNETLNENNIVKSLEDELNNCSIKCGDIKSELDNINTKIVEFKHIEKILIDGQHIKECPSCHIKLQITSDGDIVRVEDIVEKLTLNMVWDEIKKLQGQTKTLDTQYKILNQRISSLESIQDENILSQYISINSWNNEHQIKLELLEELSQQKHNKLALEKELINLKKRNIDEDKLLTKLKSTIKTLQIKLDDILKKKIINTELQSDKNYNEIISKLQQYIDDNKKLEFKREHIQDKIDEANNTIHDMSTEIEKLKSENIDIENIKIRVAKITQNIEKYNDTIQNSLEIKTQIQQYQKYTEMSEKLDEWKFKCDEQKIKYQRDEELYQASLTLEKKCIYAEMNAIEDTVDTINAIADRYIKSMFETSPDPDVTVRLCTLKENKDGTVRPKINVQIEYRGHQISDINDVSGGEQDRMALAYVLAMNEIFDSPILMLDECLSSLDSELNSDIICKLENFAENKLVLVVSHEANEGLFKEEVQVE